MKIAVLSDIHGNYPALETVTDHIESWGADMVFVAGDIVNRGPRSHDCLWFLEDKKREKGWKIIRGNHEDYVISRDDPEDPKEGPRYELFKPTHFIYQQLNFNVSSLKSLPEVFYQHSPDYGGIRMVHASMRHNRDGIYPETPASELHEQIDPPPEVFITGHTHRPLVRRISGTLVVNAGSVGLPFDGDHRTGYAQIIWDANHWQSEIIRLDYDIDRAEKEFYDTGYLEGAGPLAKIVLSELKSSLSQLYLWSMKYTNQILDGKITVEKSTEEFLREPITKPYW
jgi:predicted phosphodiesterase